MLIAGWADDLGGVGGREKWKAGFYGPDKPKTFSLLTAFLYIIFHKISGIFLEDFIDLIN